MCAVTTARFSCHVVSHDIVWFNGNKLHINHVFIITIRIDEPMPSQSRQIHVLFIIKSKNNLVPLMESGDVQFKVIASNHALEEIVQYHIKPLHFPKS